MLLASLTDLFVKLSTHSEICDDDAILDQARQSQLRAMLDQAAIDCSAGFVPSTLSCFKFSILPDFSFILGRKSLPVCGQTCGIHDIFIVLATTVVADLEVLHDFKQLVIIKASIHSYYNRYIGTILFPDFLNDINQHAIGGITMIGMLFASPEYCVNKESAPV